jgi:hypothetical protein
MALTLRAIVVVLIGLVGLVAGSLIRPVEAQAASTPFQIGQSLVVSLVTEHTVRCVVIEKRGDWVSCDTGKPDPFKRGPAETTWYNIANALSITIQEK